MSRDADDAGTGAAAEDAADADGVTPTGRPSAEGAARLAGFAASLADSAGQPWQGREFDDNPFGDDDGSAPPALLGALAAFRAGETGAETVVDALRDVRLLIPLMTDLGDEGTNDAGMRVDKTQELSIVTVAGPDGRTVQPVFSSVTALQAWNPSARPVPVDSRRAALAAAAEGTELIVLDPTSETEFVLRRPAVWAVAQGTAWVPSDRDAEVREAFQRSIASELGVHDVALLAGDPGNRLVGEELVVRLSLAAGLTREELDAILSRLAQRWAADDVIATRVDSLRVQLVASGD
ncbi:MULTISPECIES: SseB family protein [unclassified Leifsonia]|uniref:SseB family protein n=1 Tax=unclassified Leifsonia TaxID=2663824 RepID=UPI0003661E29|nr:MULTISPECIES: SseB family protein [unclassified Leifsonia]TDP99653.1 type III secretion system (T3SS) SseB-like protein [Leifsonia sp. 115AMFTsu3.1]